MKKSEKREFIVQTLENLYPIVEIPLDHINDFTFLIAVTKAKNIFMTSEILIEKFNSKVPDNFEDLESLPGVGHKTSSVIMSQIFKVPAFPVDTHIHRLAKRWRLSSGKNVKKTEEDLKKFFEKNLWNKLHLQIIFYGREFCKASKNKSNCECKICICSRI